MNNVLIIGCGDIGLRVAALWQQRGIAVCGLARSTNAAKRLQQAGIKAISGDLDARDTLSSLPTKDALVYYFAPPPNTGHDDPRMSAFIASIKQARWPAKIVYISTTAVYGDCNGAWVTEQTPVNPQSERGKRRLSAENSLLAWHQHSGVPVIILRVAGIYGPGRLPIARLQQGQPVLNEDESPFSNRIHAEDLATICVKAADYHGGETLYNVSDGHPTTMTDYFNRIADTAGLPRPPVVSRQQAENIFSPNMLSFLRESKRIDNHKVLTQLTTELRYPDLGSGLASCL